ncbi:MAG: threonine--tRNA ligase [Gemmatales bacterium]|nr:threonine--tRNA ligase [Gemmatales bacterium]MDW8386590.1 threonine--tRNA ligase [Gemmatales bacterium]
MLTIRFPDGSVKSFPEGTRPRDIAEAVSKRLARSAVAAKVNGVIVDLDRELHDGHGEIQFQILTDQDREALDVLRHSCAHVMARAVMRLFPGAKLAFGPTIENGFYYDIDVTPPIREEDFPRIEAEMRKIIEQAEPFERFERPTAEARTLVADLGQDYKVEHIDEELSKFPTLSFYRQGEFIDLCRGPHIPHAGKIGAFKLLSIAGAYWKNDASRPQLQRLYGTAFFSQKDLDAYLKQVEEARKRDHRVLGKQLKLFTIASQVGSGLILWMPKGAMVRSLLESFIRDELIKRGYQPVYTPHIGRLELYRTSGHFPYYRDAQFPPMYFQVHAAALDVAQYRLAAGELDDAKERQMSDYLRSVGFVPPGYMEARTQAERLEAVHRHVLQLLDQVGIALPDYRSATNAKERAKALLGWLEQQEGYLLKPMNCPHHINIYKAEQRSYRDLPVRLAEFGTVYRFEQTGELSGMTRVRGFTQDDAHLFVTPEQIEAELVSNLELVLFVLRSVGLEDYRVRVGLRDPKSDKYVGSDANWKQAEENLIRTVRNLGMNYSAEEGEAAFYGPKVDFVVRDCIGREWQLGTVQLDYNLPERFELEYIGPDNAPHRPVMIHRAPFGSMERFCGILIEHFAGAFPLWLAPEQARILPVSEKVFDYARKVEAEFRQAGFRVSGDYRPEKIGYKIREAQLEKIPYMLVVGEKERDAGTVALRDRLDGDLGSKPIAEVLDLMRSEVQNRRIRQTSSASAGLSDQTARFAE